LSILVFTLFLLVILGFLLRQPIGKTQSFVSQFTGSGLTDHLGVVNFLILGIGGENHEGSDLTDSMIFTSLNTNTKNVTLVTIPRDVWVYSLRAKINTAYHYGFEKGATEGGILLAKSAVSEIINQPVDYVVILDFSTFESAIDLIGGVDINIDRTFTDEDYPIAGKETDLCNGDSKYRCRFEKLVFTQGLAHMDGVTALKFVRSRYSLDEIEGTDFGRSKRQEKVISAFITKLLSPDTIRRPQKYLDLFNLFSKSLLTDLKPSQYFSLGKLLFKFRNSHPRTFSISQPGELYNPPISPRHDNQWVLVPKGDNPRVIYDFVSTALGTP